MLMASIGLYVVPKAGDPATVGIENAQSEVKEVVNLMRLVATRGAPDASRTLADAPTSANRLWSELADEDEEEEEEESEHLVSVSTAKGEADNVKDCDDASGGGGQDLACGASSLVEGAFVGIYMATQIDHGLINTAMVTEESSLVCIAAERTYYKILVEIEAVKMSLETVSTDPGDSSDDLASTVVSDLSWDPENYSGRRVEECTITARTTTGRCEEAVGRTHGAMHDIANARLEIHLELLGRMAAEIGEDTPTFQTDCSEFGEHDELGQDCEDMMSELMTIRVRFHFILQSLCNGASVLLPPGGAGSSSICLLSFDPEWTSVPMNVSLRAECLRNDPPEYLTGLELEDADPYDILINDIFAKPCSRDGYVTALQELQAICSGQLDDVCGLLGLPIPWLELKRALVGKAVMREGEFSLFDLVEEVRGEHRRHG